VSEDRIAVGGGSGAFQGSGTSLYEMGSGAVKRIGFFFDYMSFFLSLDVSSSFRIRNDLTLGIENIGIDFE